MGTPKQFLDYPGLQKYDELIKNYLEPVKTTEGALVSFPDGGDLPLSTLIVNVEPQQDLHGQDAPWVGGAGKNKLPMTVDGIKAANTSGTWSGNAYTRNGVTFTLLTDNDGNVTSIKANGTSTSDNEFNLTTYRTNNYKGYIINGSTGGSSATYNLLIVYSNNGTSWANEGYATNGDTTIRSDYDYVRFGILIRNGVTVTNEAFYPMIRLATETDSTFAPYSNICPISGHTGVDIYQRGKNLANPATITTLYPTGASGTYQNQIRNSSNARSVIAEVTPNTTYTISKKAGQRFRLAFTAEEPRNGIDDYGYEWNDTGTTITVTSPSNAKYMVVLFWSANVDTDTEEDMLATLQIELGETATAYEPYAGSEIDITFPTEAGDVYGGKLDILSGVLTVTHKEITYDGSENWILHNSNRFYLDSLPTGLNTAEKATSISNKGIYRDTAWGAIGSYFTFGSSGIYINKTNAEQTLEDFKQSLGTTNYQVKYPLATPITYQLTPHQVNSLLGYNNIWADTGDVDVTYTTQSHDGITAKYSEATYEVIQTATEADSEYEVLLSGTADNADRIDTVNKSADLTFNPSTGNLTATKFTGDISEGTGLTDTQVTTALGYDPQPTKTASGSLVSFNDGADLPMPSFICNIDAVQDLHGYDAPWVGGAYINKMPPGESKSTSNYGVTITSDGNGVYTFIGTCTQDFEVTFDCDDFTIPSADNSAFYLFNTEANADTIFVFYNGSNVIDTWSLNPVNKVSTYTGMKGLPCNKYGMRLKNGVTYNLIIKPMLAVGKSYTSYEPYSNICPISGHTGLDAWVRGKNQLPMTVDGIKAVNTSGTWSGNVYTFNGVKFTIQTDTDGNVVGIEVNGTASSTASLVFLSNAANNYIGQLINCNGVSGNGQASISIQYFNGSTFQKSYILPDSTTNYEIEDVGDNISIFVRIASGYTVNNITFKPMIRLATEQDTTFEPYNPNSQTIQVSWQTEAGEVFGGYIDLVSGVLVVDRVSVTYDGSNDETWQIVPGDVTAKIIGSAPNSKPKTTKVLSNYFFSTSGTPWIFDNTIWTRYSQLHVNPDSTIIPSGITQEGLAEWRTWLSTNNLQAVYELATPQTYQLTPTQIKSLLGTNNAWCDTGDVNIQYITQPYTDFSTKQYVDDAIATAITDALNASY